MIREQPLGVFNILARNLPEHRSNPIHTDEGAIAQGFPSALVAGVTVYAYLTNPPATAWGLPWIVGGSAEVRFSTPVIADAPLVCAPRTEADSRFVDATSNGQTNASCEVHPIAVDRPVLRDGEKLQTVETVLDDQWARYGQRCGDPLPLYDNEGIAHPAAWPSLANDVMHTQVVEGAWIHTRSRISHLGLARQGDQIQVEATIVKRFESRSGERAIVDVVISNEAGPLAYLEHEALIKLHRS